MADNLTQDIKNIKGDGRVSKEIKIAAAKLESYVGTSKPIPTNIKKEILNLRSESDIANQLKNYVKNK